MRVLKYLFVAVAAVSVAVAVNPTMPTVSAEPCTITVTNTNDAGAGSLRQAVIDANLMSGLDVICFSISGGGVKSIALTSPLSPVIYPVYLDGTTQPGYSSSNPPLIEINGQNAFSGSIPERGLYLTNQAQGSTILGLTINRFRSHGIFLDTKNITIKANVIGLDATGTQDAGNGDDGIGILSGTTALSAVATGNVIGGTTPAERNVISGNAGNGVGITSYGGGDASSNTVIGNYIGTNFSGTAGIGNTGDGVLINSVSGTGTTSSNIIGSSTGTTPLGSCTGGCNLISGNVANGIGTWFSGANDNVIKGNYVGVNVTGTAAIANGNIGIELNESANNQVGGTTPAERNIFSGNLGAGVFITGVFSTGNVVSGNFIGTNAAGTAAIPNVKMGLSIGPSNGPPLAAGASSNIIGGTTGTTPTGSCSGSCNLISGNSGNGILLSDGTSGGNSILGNFIGIALNGTSPLGNVADGIGILSVPNTSIGNGTDAGRNVIGSNGSNGIIVVGGGSTGNRIHRNIIGKSGLGNTKSGVSISGATDTAVLENASAFNGGLAIDLDNNGTTNANDPGDGDGGANRMQNFPNIYAAKSGVSETKIGGNYNGAPSTTIQIDFYANSGCNAGYPNNYGETERHIGSTTITTDIFGNSSFGFTTTSVEAGGTYITSTATKKIGSVAAETSEASQCILINVAKPALTNGATWFLKNDLTTGPADKTFGYGLPSTLLMCAWDPDQPGVKLPVVVVNSTWFMRASYTTGTADRTFQYGFTGATPLCGDWNGDGIETPGLAADGSLQKLGFFVTQILRAQQTLRLNTAALVQKQLLVTGTATARTV